MVGNVAGALRAPAVPLPDPGDAQVLPFAGTRAARRCNRRVGPLKIRIDPGTSTIAVPRADVAPVRSGRSPIAIRWSSFAVFANDRHAVLLESAVTDGQRGRYSYIAVEPFQILSSKNGKIALGERSTGQSVRLLGGNWPTMRFSRRQVCRRFKAARSAISAMSWPSIWSACRWRAMTRCSFRIW